MASKSIDEQARILVAKFQKKGKELDSLLAVAIMESSIFVENKAVLEHPWKNDTGLLQKSITHRVIDRRGYPVGQVGTNVEYACIFGSNTIIKTAQGNKRITDVSVGDMVLTQTGEYRHVTKCIQRPAKEVPDLVTIACEYRKGRVHTITTTKEHKFIAIHEGRNKWIEAGQLTMDDKLFSMKKKAHNNGIHINPDKVCIECGSSHRNQGKKFCSNECKFTHWSKGNNPHIGMKRTESGKSNMSYARARMLSEHPERHINRILSGKGFETSVEKRIREWLDSRGVAYTKQYRIGKSYADFYLPETNEVIEGDGAFWHQDQSIDIERDKRMLKAIPDLKITHLHFYEKRFSMNIDPNPLPNVYYQVCNPHADSFVNLEVFSPRKILSIKHHRYEKTHRNHAMSAMVYDLTVDTVHSYYANGILVSNSFLEFGTSKMQPYPFLLPALNSSRPTIKEIITRRLKQAL